MPKHGCLCGGNRKARAGILAHRTLACHDGQCRLPRLGRSWGPAVTPWPQCGEELLAELRRAPGRLALAVDDQDGKVVGAFAELRRTAVYHAGVCLLTPEPPTSPSEVIDRLVAAEPVIVDLDILFWKPWLALDPLGVLRAVSRRRPATLFAWPGTISGTHATYSSPGRRDWFDATLSDAIVLRPATALFPDEPAYRIERFA